MLAFLVDKENTKNFMNKLFKTEAFDKLEVRSVFLETIVRYEILGHINKDYLKDEEERFFATWKELKFAVLSLIKGEKKPKTLKIVFSLNEKSAEKLNENAQALFLNISYENEEIAVTTGTNQKVFSMDKTLDLIWEDTIKNFFSKNEIKVTIM